MVDLLMYGEVLANIGCVALSLTRVCELVETTVLGGAEHMT
jgi:hypothetical protein